MRAAGDRDKVALHLEAAADSEHGRREFFQNGCENTSGVWSNFRFSPLTACGGETGLPMGENIHAHIARGSVGDRHDRFVDDLLLAGAEGGAGGVGVETAADSAA
jgi:hypothetical protein